MDDTKPIAAITDLETSIIRQVEYYFGDVNLPKDKFLQEEIKKNDGWVEMEKLLTFNRLKTLSADAHEICTALRKSQNNIVEVSDDNSKVRRSETNPVPENRLEFWKLTKARTLYVKGFPVDASLDDLMTFFAKFGKVDNIFMRRTFDKQKTFKGSVFVTFETKEICSTIVNLESMKYGDVELEKLMQDVYFGKKEEERKERKAQSQANRKAVNAMVRNKNKPEKQENEKPLGTLLHLTDFGEDGAKLTREIIKAALQEKGDIKWIDFQKGDKEAFVRFAERENSAAEVLAKMEVGEKGEVQLGADGIKCKVCLLTGDEEKSYWEKAAQARQASFQRKNEKKFKGGKKFNRGKHGKDRKGGRNGETEKKASDNVENETAPAKKEAVKRPAEEANGGDAEKPAKAQKTE